MDNRPAGQERERQISSLRHPATNGYYAQAPPPTSLLKSQDFQSTISSDDMMALARAEYRNPVISLYLQFNAEKVAPRGKPLLRHFHSLKERVLRDRAEWIEAMRKAQKKQLMNGLDEVEIFLSEHTSPEEIHALVIFKSGEELNRVIALPIRIADSLTIDVDPYLGPLEAALEQNERVLFIEVSRTESRFLIYHLGYCQEGGKIKMSLAAQPIDGDTMDGARKRLTHFEWHLKRTAIHAFKLFNAYACGVLVVMGEEHTAHFLEKYLHETLGQKIVSRIYSAPANDARPRKDLIENALREYRSARELSVIQEIGNYKPGEELVTGLRDVMEACNLFLVRKLFAADNLPAKGFVCRQHHYMSFAAGECPYCGSKLLEVGNLLDERFEFVRMHGAEVTLFEYQQNLLAPYEGIAAVTYTRVNYTSERRGLSKAIP